MNFPLSLLTVSLKFQPECWLVLGFVNRGLMFGALGFIVKVSRT